MKWITALVFFVSFSTQAGIVRWELTDARLEDGSNVTGHFDFDWAGGMFYPYLDIHAGTVTAYDFTFAGKRFLNQSVRASPVDLAWMFPSAVLPVGINLSHSTVDENWGEILASLTNCSFDKITDARSCQISDPRPGTTVEIRTLTNDMEMRASGIGDLQFVSGELVAGGQASALRTSPVPEPTTAAIAAAMSLLLLAFRKGRLLPF